MKTSRDPNFELNLLPVISLLAVLISFLLLTTVWIQIGAIEVKQAVGESGILEEAQRSQSVVVKLHEDGSMTISLKNESLTESSKRVDLKASPVQWTSLESVVKSIKESNPEIALGFVEPSKASSMQVVVRAVEILKTNNINQVGVSPILM